MINVDEPSTFRAKDRRRLIAEARLTSIECFSLIRPAQKSNAVWYVGRTAGMEYLTKAISSQGLCVARQKQTFTVYPTFSFGPETRSAVTMHYLEK